MPYFLHSFVGAFKDYFYFFYAVICVAENVAVQKSSHISNVNHPEPVVYFPLLLVVLEDAILLPGRLLCFGGFHYAWVG